jgi:hypothetical protein
MPRAHLHLTLAFATLLAGTETSFLQTQTQQEAPPKPSGPTIEYRNKQYGFCVSLPPSWSGYTIVVDLWTGSNNNGPHGYQEVEHGPLLSIRHPRWTQVNPRQDIPIMVFTRPQWDSLQKDNFHIGAAPIGPSELGQNSKYVFALPARYNFALPAGFEEVEQILQNKPLHTRCEKQ